jgi:hypothetical protein
MCVLLICLMIIILLMIINTSDDINDDIDIRLLPNVYSSLY